ncbi:HU family DNA-binding protein [Candidatus Palauibacter sp.]
MELRGFGTFKVQRRKPRTARNPGQGNRSTFRSAVRRSPTPRDSFATG